MKKEVKIAVYILMAIIGFYAFIAGFMGAHYVGEMSEKNFFYAILFVVLFLILYKLRKWIKFSKPILFVVGVVMVTFFIMAYIPNMILSELSDDPRFYAIKKYIYTNSVNSYNTEFLESFLPNELPTVCESYNYETRGRVPAQDYHPWSCLKFYTDRNTQKEYADYYKGLCDIYVTDSAEFEEHKEFVLEYFVGFTNLYNDYWEYVSNVELYGVKIDMYHYAGILIDYNTGFVTILT